ncbi:MAG: phosphate ABC transporter ATP-binding protein, partial [Pseudomonadota bacterium]
FIQDKRLNSVGYCCATPKHKLDFNSSRNSFLAVENLTVLRGSKKIIEDVSFKTLPGTITAIVGPSGVGKSTFLKSMNRILETEAATHFLGDIKIEGISIFDKNTDLRRLRRKVGMVFQKPTPFPVSIFKNIAIPLCDESPMSRADLDIAVELNLSSVGLWEEVKDKLHSSALSLSGGQQQRLCIARAMSLKPTLMLLDEPCSSLDPMSTATMEQLLLDLRCQTTMLIVTHNLAQAKRISDQTALFWPENGVGKMVEVSRTKDFFGSPSSLEAKNYVNGLSG